MSAPYNPAEHVPAGVIYSEQGECQIFDCDGVAALRDLSTRPNPENERTHEGVRPYGGERWLGLPVDECEAVLDSGIWAEGVVRMRAALDGIECALRPQANKRRRVRRDQGAEVDITQYWRGRADVAWQDCRRQPVTSARRVVVRVKFGGLSGVTPDEMFWRGAAALMLADKLQAAGYQVRVEAVHTSARVSDDDRHVFCVRVPVKAYDAPLDLNSLAVTVALAGFFRVLTFRAKCAMRGTVRSSFGRTCRYDCYMPAFDDAGVVSVLAETGEADSEEQAAEWVRAQIARIEAAQLA